MTTQFEDLTHSLQAELNAWHEQRQIEYANHFHKKHYGESIPASVEKEMRRLAQAAQHAATAYIAQHQKYKEQLQKLHNSMVVQLPAGIELPPKVVAIKGASVCLL